MADAENGIKVLKIINNQILYFKFSLIILLEICRLVAIPARDSRLQQLLWNLSSLVSFINDIKMKERT